MTTTYRTLERLSIAVAAGLTIFAAAFCEAQVDVPPPTGNAADQTASVDANANVEVLTSGPVHEAFANPVTLNSNEGLVISASPPEPIAELPPKVMPEGQNVEWIPGYWAWDEGENDFLWVSGLWRNVPPDQRWVPGYWAQVDNGHRWVSGFWTAADSQNLEYLPYPPESQEYGPNAPAPGEGYFWMPGNWVYISGQYQWQPGYWAQAYDEWCWVPQQYVWTPRGALYLAGYWDYRVPYRGTLFAPVRFVNRGYYQDGRRYTPGYVINPTGLLVSLFIRPQYGHYYFGNYYGDEYYQLGYRPWFDASYRGHYHYDPLLAFYESYYDRRGIDFSGRINQWFNFYDQNPDRRPARTWNESAKLASRTDVDADTTIQLARPLQEFVAGDDNLRRDFRQLTDDQRTSFARTSGDFRELIANRGRVETGASAEVRGDSKESNARAQGRANVEIDRGRDQPDARDNSQQRAGDRGLQLPPVMRRGQEIPGEGRDKQTGPRNAETPNRESVAPAERGEQPSNAAGNRARGRMSRPETPQRPENQPQLENRRIPNVVPNNQGAIPNQGQARQPSPGVENRQPGRNIFQPRRGSIPEANSNNANRIQRPQVDPRDAIPQFRSRGNAAPDQSRGQGALQGRGRSGDAPAVRGNRGNRGNGNRDNRDRD